MTSERSKRQDTTLDIAVVRLGGHGEWQIALQSDGGAVVTRLEENEGGGTVGVGLTFSPIGLDASARVALTAGYRSGRAWRFADARAAGAFLEGAMRDSRVQAARPPDIKWHGFAGMGRAEATARDRRVHERRDPGRRGGGDRDAARRARGGRSRSTSGARRRRSPSTCPASPPHRARRGALVADVTYEDGAPVELALRTATERDGRMEEIAARLDLHDAANRRWPSGCSRPAARAATSRRSPPARRPPASSSATATRRRERRRGLSIAGRLGISLGVSHERVQSERRLVDAVAWAARRPAPIRRFDCLGV